MNNQPENITVGETSGKVPQFSVGAVLREAREQQGLTVADVANRIKFAPRQIEAMEADDFAHLPEMTFVRGFVRSYARLLEMDAAPLLAALPQKHVQPSANSERKTVEVPFPSMLTSRRSNMVWLGAGLLVVLALIIFSRMHDTPGELAQPAAQTNVETLELPLSALDAASAPVAAEASPGMAVAESSPKKQAAATRAPESLPPAKALPAKGRAALESPVKDKPAMEKKSGEQALKSPAGVVKKSATAAASGVSGLASMRLVFDEDSWVDVKDATGKILLSKMNHAGSLVRLSGVAPLSVVIGHASGVHLFYDGKEINLAPYTSVEVARLLLE